MDQEIATSDTTLAFDFAIAASEKKNLHNHNTNLYKRDFFLLFPFVQRLRVSKLDSLFHLATCNFFIRMGLQDAPNKEKLEGELPPVLTRHACSAPSTWHRLQKMHPKCSDLATRTWVETLRAQC